MKHVIKFVIVALVFFSGCKEKKEINVKRAAIFFDEVPSEVSGIDFSNDLFHSDDLNIMEYLYYYNGGGVAIGDINNDGLDDIYLSANQKSDRLYLNLGNLKFKDITEEAGIKMDSTWSSGVTMEDVNNDGFLDIYVSKVGNYKVLKAHNLLYINKGDNSFTESSKVYGIDFSGLSTQASFFDYDNDGDMDLYLMNHSVHTPRSYGSIDRRKIKDSLSGDKLYENRLDQNQIKFVDVTEASGIYSSALGYGLALTTSDVNNDGLIDIYVGNDFHENDYLYINQGNKTFKESGVDYLSHTSRFTMGLDIADINNDQQLDIFSLDMMPFDHEIFLKSGGEDSDKVSQIKENFGFRKQYARNTLQLNQQNKAFTDIALMTNTYATDWSWSALIQDYDNDGHNDIYVTNGIYKRPNDLDYINYLSNVNFSKYNQSQQNDLEESIIKQIPTIKIPNVVFRNKGDLEFEMLTEKAGSNPSYSNGSAYSDLDNDGDLDIVVNTINQTALLLENKSTDTINNNYISFTLKGDSIYKNTTGAKLYIYADNMVKYNELNVTRGFQSSSTHKIHFGIGKTQKIDSVKVQWLDGTFQIIKGVSVNQHHVLTRDNSAQKSIKLTVSDDKKSFRTFPFSHLENNYVDYEKEPLMPEKLSTEGPALVKADFNGDGLEDIFIGGAKHQSSELFLRKGDGTYFNKRENDFNKDVIYEDVDVTAFDLEKDGDLDLYVMSGGNESVEGDPYLEDRVYINDGNANFRRLIAPLIKTNGGSVSSGDFDGDGFDDLFIGNRSMSRGYGLSPYSFILKNSGKGSFEIVKKVRLGMVTDSQWTDLNNDKKLELVVVGDYMPITVYSYQRDSTFVNDTKKYGLDQTQGMWNSVLVADIDGNGEKDIIAGNAGLNFKFKASKERPVKIYIDDFDDNGQVDPIIFYDFFGNNVPFASKNKLMDQMPSLKKKFLSYSKFSKIASIEDLTGKPEKDILEIKKIVELRSMMYMNVGNKTQEIPLPNQAQMSSIEDVLLDTTDNKQRIIFVGNYLDYTAELGESNGNSGGVISFSNKFDSYHDLPLPRNLNARKIIKISENEFLVVANNDKTYIFTLTND